MLGPVSLSSDETLDENLSDVLATISELNNTKVRNAHEYMLRERFLQPL